jgi:hypothetical protein
MRFLLLFLCLSLLAWADPETNTYSLIVEELKGAERDVQLLDRLMEKKSGFTSRELDMAKAKYADLKILYDGERKKLAQFRTSGHVDARDTVQKMVDSQDKWASSALFVVDMQCRAVEYYKGKNVGYDPDRGQASVTGAQRDSAEARQLYNSLKATVADKLLK